MPTAAATAWSGQSSELTSPGTSTACWRSSSSAKLLRRPLVGGRQDDWRGDWIAWDKGAFRGILFDRTGLLYGLPHISSPQMVLGTLDYEE